MDTSTTSPAANSLVSANWLTEHLDDPTVRIVEVDVSGAAYGERHIPHALLWNAYTDLRDPDYKTIDTGRLEQLLERSGVEPTTTLAFYGYAAHLGYWLVKAHGHQRAVVLDWPRDSWTGHWTSETEALEATKYTLPAPTTRLSPGELLAFPGAILDVRAEGEYAGERFWPSAAPEERGRAGHVPGAVNLPITELRSETGFRPLQEMRAALLRHGLAPHQQVATYCTIGNRASQAWYALTHLLGFSNVAVYYGGWAEWGNDPTLPVER